MTESTQATPEAPTARILIVDDNRIYREAFRRNLTLQNYDVIEAENMTQALEKLSESQPDVVITDLQMRTETEGLDLIRSVKLAMPLLPVIMISAVGTFEEGALAQKHGAGVVLSKARIEDEIEKLYAAIESQRASHDQARKDDQVLQKARSAISDQDGDTSAAHEDLKTLLARQDLHPYLRSEALDLLEQTEEKLLQAEAARNASSVEGSRALTLPEVEKVLEEAMPTYRAFGEDTRESLRIAEFLYDQQTRTPDSIDFSRNIGFSYCFAVENEVKARMSKRLHKFLAHDMTYALIIEMMENNNQALSVYFHQHLLMLLREHPMDFTIDNVKQTMRRILEHQSRYKPDGLKALGIMVLAFARNYQWMKKNRTIKVHNPLALKGLASEDEVVRFAELLIRLQHLRNPYIHPEISEREVIPEIRQTAFECLNMAGKLAP